MSCPSCGNFVGHYVDCVMLRREPIGVVESVRKVDGETIATVRLGAPTDADVEHLRRAMVEAHQTYAALDAMKGKLVELGLGDEIFPARNKYGDATVAYLAAKRARGGL